MSNELDLDLDLNLNLNLDINVERTSQLLSGGILTHKVDETNKTDGTES
jgi:hypothetical protein